MTRALMHTSTSTRNGVHGLAAVVSTRDQVAAWYGLIQHESSNAAMFEAATHGAALAMRLDCTAVLWATHQDLPIRQFHGEWNVRRRDALVALETFKPLTGTFQEFDACLVRKGENATARALSKRAFDLGIGDARASSWASTLAQAVFEPRRTAVPAISPLLQAVTAPVAVPA